MDGGYTDGIRICISHCEYLSADNEKERHQIFADIPPSDIQPPASVARLEVNAIRLCMDVLEARPRPPLKRTRTAPTKINPSSSPAGPVGNSQADRVAAMEGNFATVVVPSPQLDTAAPAHLTRCKSGQGVTKLVAKTAETIVNDEYVMLSVMVDGALRLASCGGLATRQSIGLKVKANTFGHGLADVIPNIWKPGHLLVPCRETSRLLRY